MRKFDVAVIGAGTAGMQAFKAARQRTDSVALIESGPYGTTCARTGCMPSKLLIASARRAEAVRSAWLFGIDAEGPSVDSEAVMARVRALRDEFVEGVVEQVASFPEDCRLRGRARFTEPGVLDVDGERVEARAIVIATGSKPVIPRAISEGLGGRVMTIEDLFELESLPQRMVVFGAGVIGAETAMALAWLGVEVTCTSKGGRVGFLTDPRVNEAACSILSRSFDLYPDAGIGDIRTDGDEIVVRFEGDGEEMERRFDAALAATGRKPDFEGLALDASGLDLDGEGVPAFDDMTGLCHGESPVPVFIAGDADSDEPVLPKAHDDGCLVGRNAAGWPEIERRDGQPSLLIGFTEPSLAVVGEPFEALKDRRDLVIGEADFEGQGRARCDGRNAGLVRVYASRGTGRFLGAEMIAPDAEHLAHLLAWGAKAGLRVGEMAEAPVYHPVTEEGLQSALLDCTARLQEATGS